jgi:hypothetical protein
MNPRYTSLELCLFSLSREEMISPETRIMGIRNQVRVTIIFIDRTITNPVIEPAPIE